MNVLFCCFLMHLFGIQSKDSILGVLCGCSIQNVKIILIYSTSTQKNIPTAMHTCKSKWGININTVIDLMYSSSKYFWCYIWTCMWMMIFISFNINYFNMTYFWFKFSYNYVSYAVFWYSIYCIKWKLHSVQFWPCDSLTESVL